MFCARVYPKPLEPPPLEPPLSLLPPPLQLSLDELLLPQSLLDELLLQSLLLELALLLELELRVCDGSGMLNADAAPLNMLMNPALMLFKLRNESSAI